MGEIGGKIRPGWVLEEMGGQEPLIHDLQVLLHLAGCRSEGSLNAHKGNTEEWGMGKWEWVVG